MSRIGRLPVIVPKGVQASVNAGLVTVEGPRGRLEYHAGGRAQVTLEDGKLIVSPQGESKQNKADFGTTRAHLNNMVQGVSQGWKRSLELSGLGYSAKQEGSTLILAVGLSHEVRLNVPKAIKCSVNKTTIDLESSDKELLGTFAAKIRKVRPPEPYLGKGIRYAQEVIRRKAGKAGKK